MQRGESLSATQRKNVSLPEISPETVAAEWEEPNYYTNKLTHSLNLANAKSKKRENFELSTKIRDMEIMMFDVKAQLESQVNRLRGEFPAKLQKELTVIENHNRTIWKEIGERLSGFYETLGVVKSSYKNQSNTWNDRINLLQRKADETELRLISLEKSLERVSHHSEAVKSAKPTDLSVQLEAEINSLRGQVQEDRTKYEGQIDEFFRNFSAFELQTHSQVTNLTQMVKRLSEDRKIFHATPKKETEGPTKLEVEQMRLQVSSLERKLEEEAIKRINLEEVIVKYLDDKVVSVKEKMKQGEKGSLQREKQMLENLQKGLVTVNDILKGSNEENSIKIAKVEAEFAQLFASFTQLIENIKESLGKDIKQQGNELQILIHRHVEFEESSSKELKSLYDFFNDELMKLDAKLMGFNKNLCEAQNNLAERLKNLKGQMMKVESSLIHEIMLTKKEAASNLFKVREYFEQMQKSVKEDYLILKYAFEETKKEVNKRCLSNEQIVFEKINYMDKQISAKIDSFTVYIDNTVKSHMTKVNEVIDAQLQNIEGNRKSLDEHIRQQGKTVRALSRALVNKETAERKESIDALGLRIASKFTTLETNTSTKLLNLELNIKKEEIMIGTQAMIVVDDIVNSVERNESNNQIGKLQNEIQKHKEKMNEINNLVNKVCEDLKDEAEKRGSIEKSLEDRLNYVLQKVEEKVSVPKDENI
eukprot:TRINITY_DN10765_c0_g1_i3.p1 TRINITY_DN10765_c0_g1~~TRINITY_DN10765_c0_g1_i3.p1  ORF type:complete len:706 (+),score=132.22 TRINITY_DN10765_c0_g1_i3:183-2300(+)